MRRALLVLAGLALSSPGLSTGTASACDQITVTPTARDALSRRYVLLGKVVENAEWDRSAARTQLRYTLEPVRVWKGRWPGERKRFRYETTGSAACGYPLKLGAYYVFASDEEPMVSGQPIALPDAHDLVGALDRARRLPPLRVPEEALLPPHHMGCAEQFAVPDRMLADAERVVVGRFARNDVISRPTNMTSRLQGDLLTTEWVKGRGPRSLPVIKDFDYPMGNAEDFSKPHIWFLGPRRADGRTEVIGSWYAGGLQDVRYRYARWRILGADCVTP
jgi:hypothetical protein